MLFASPCAKRRALLPNPPLGLRPKGGSQSFKLLLSDSRFFIPNSRTFP